eukprot:Skav224786  [mRNA]  locus=scaffold428:642434:642679:- [translate_table: standard]
MKFTLPILFVEKPGATGGTNETTAFPIRIFSGDAPAARPITVTTEEPAVPSAPRLAVKEAATPDPSDDEETADTQKERRCR